jgi:signal transduction histidine kinase
MLKRLAANPRAAIGGLMRCLCAERRQYHAKSLALKVTTRDFGESIEVRVRDNGVGIPPENMDKLF